MGAHMARSLHRAGLLTGVWNRTAAKGDGARRGTSLPSPSPTSRNWPGNCEAVVICVSADEDLARRDRGPRAGIESQHDRDGLLHGGRRDRARDSRPARRARRGISRLPGERRRGGCTHGGASPSWWAATRPVFARAQPILEAMGKTVAYLGAERRRPGGEGHQPNHVRGHHPGRRRSHGFRARRRPAARSLDRAARQGRGLELVLRQSRAVHGAQCIFPRVFACACTRRICGSAATWRRGTARRTAGGRIHAGAVCAA